MAEFFNNLDGEQRISEAASRIPANPVWRPSDDFIICRDASGEVTAAYGGNKWDLNPIRLKASRIMTIDFDSMFDKSGAEQDLLIRETRYLLFCLLFYVRTGQLGRMSAGVLVHYFMTLRAAARYCYSQQANPLVGALSLQQLFTTPAYLNAYSQWMIKTGVGGTQRTIMRALVTHLVAIGESRLGYKLHGVFDLDFGCSEMVANQQHPVIPTRIYLDAINSLGEWVNVLYPKRAALEGFLLCFENPCYGYTEHHQKTLAPNGAYFQPEFVHALRLHQVDSVFTGDLACLGRGVLSSAILKIQWILKTVIHLYTGMRDQEVLRLPYDCIDDEEVVAASVDDDHVTRDKPMIVQVLSTTTKFAGYRKTVSWLATDDVVRAVEVARSICRAISKLFGVRPEDMPLFLNPAIINRSNTKIGVPTWNTVSKPKFLVSRYLITDDDFQELQVSDPNRDFSSETEFSIGSPWPFSSHQFRRSLAFYGSNSGFISLPSLRKQFKQLTTQMARYYANNFDKLKTIFGYYDEAKDDFVLPKNHVLFEYQTGVPMNVAYDLIEHAFGSDAPLFGGTGSYIANQREKMDKGDIYIVELRKETEKQAAEGKISYRPTLLGACTYIGKCEFYLLGAVTSCLSCKDGVIEKSKLESAIDDNEADLRLYEHGSGEYQVIETELTHLKKFHQKFISVVEV